MQHAYSFLGSRLHLVLEEKVAEGYNTVAKEFVEAQKRFKEEYGIQWTPDLPLEMNATPEEFKAYDDIAKLINLLVKINGGNIDITEEECTADTLVRV